MKIWVAGLNDKFYAWNACGDHMGESSSKELLIRDLCLKGHEVIDACDEECECNHPCEDCCCHDSEFFPKPSFWSLCSSWWIYRQPLRTRIALWAVFSVAVLVTAHFLLGANVKALTWPF